MHQLALGACLQLLSIHVAKTNAKLGLD